MTPSFPTMRDPDNLVYFREEVGGLCMGGYERHPALWALDGVPDNFNGRLLAPDWPRFAEIMDGAIRRVPAIGDAGINRMINGPEAFTPDNEFILGESEHPPGGGSLPHRDRHGLRQPRSGVDTEARTERWVGDRRGSNQRPGLLRAVGSKRTGHPLSLYPR